MQVVESPEKLWLVKEKEERDVVVVRGISLLSESDALLRAVLTFNHTTYQHSTYSQNWYTVWSMVCSSSFRRVYSDSENERDTLSTHSE